MILDEYVEVIMVGKNCKYYGDKGYPNKYGTKVMVKVDDLPQQSNVKISAKCDYCSETVVISYQNYNKSCNNNDGKYCCFRCSPTKTQQVLLKKYGVNNPMHILTAKEKLKQTMLERYGVENASQSEEIQNKRITTVIKKYGGKAPINDPQILKKIQETNLQRYGVTNINKLSSTIKKRKQTNLQRYGFEHGLQSPIIRKKCKLTIQRKYGVDNVMQNKEIKEKAVKSLNDNNSQKVSTQQKYLADLYNGELNHPCSSFSLDIYLPEHQLDIEYNGGGHDLCVQMNTMTQEEFNQKEIIRGRIIRSKGINQMTLISRNDKLPSDEILFQMLDKALKYFQETNHHWITYDIDHQTIENALGTFFYDYGQLRSKRQFYQEITKEAS